MDPQVVDPEVDDEPQTALERPYVPADIQELSIQTDPVAIVKKRADIMDALRTASIRLTMPSDWTLFKNPLTGAVTGFLGDQGCDRIKAIWGIQIESLTPPERTPPSGTTDGVFAYSITGDGHCKITGESVYRMEGTRYSNERYAEEKPEGIQREIAVKKAARANLDGGITRELAGMKAVPLEELTRGWLGTDKKIEFCNKGRGFGTASERVGGANSVGIDPQDIPICEVCEQGKKKGTKLVLRNGPKGQFWGCPNYADHKDKPYTYDHNKLLKEIEERKTATGGPRPPVDREPGAEG